MRYLLITIVSLTTVYAVQVSRSQEVSIPDDVSYSIIDSSTLPGVKRSLEVRLNKKVSTQTLHAIATKLKSQDSQDYARTFMTYYLPGMPIGAGAWATTHFNPDLEVQILGLTAKEEDNLVLAQAAPADHQIIGRWIDESPYVGSRITILSGDGKLFGEQIFKDGSSFKRELVEKQSPLGRRFDRVDSRTGDHWVITSNGNLQLRDNDGLIRTAKEVK